MKTAIHQLIDRLDEVIEELEGNCANDLVAGLVVARVEANKLFEKEKEQIMKAYKDHHDLGHIYGLNTEWYYFNNYIQQTDT
jgi:hypothetical protein